MLMKVMSLNLLMGAEDPDRWSGLAALVRAEAPQILALQEASGWDDHYDRSRLEEAEEALGMSGEVAFSHTGFNTAVMIDQSSVEWVEWRTKYEHVTFHGHSEAVVRVAGFPHPLVVISAHLTPWSTDAAAQEAQILLGRANKENDWGILAGDVNHVPLGDPEPPWEEISATDRAARTIASDPVLRANRAVGQVLARGDLVDVAAHLADIRNDPSLRAPTGHDGQLRGDQIWVTKRLAPAVIDYRRISTRVDDVELSDHDAVVATLDLTRL